MSIERVPCPTVFLQIGEGNIVSVYDVFKEKLHTWNNILVANQFFCFKLVFGKHAKYNLLASSGICGLHFSQIKYTDGYMVYEYILG